MKSKFNIGDKVKIINYGHLMCEHVDDHVKIKGCPVYKTEGKYVFVDMEPHLKGRRGLISGITKTQGDWGYKIVFKHDSLAWLDEEQLELINANPNTL